MVTPPADVLGRLAIPQQLRKVAYAAAYAVRWEKSRDPRFPPAPPTTEAYVDAALEAVFRELAGMVDRDVLEAAEKVGFAAPLCPDHDGEYAYKWSTCKVCRRHYIRAAAGVLLAPSVAEIGRLRSVLAEIASKKSLCVPRVWQMAEEAIRDK